MRIVLALLATLVAMTAQAADFKSFKDPITVTSVPSNAWSAIWGAALVGYHMSNTTLDADRNYDFNHDTPLAWENAARLDGFGGEGFSGDLQIGGDVQLRGRFVLGAFAEYSFGGTESNASVSPAFGSGASINIEQNDSYSILARAGITSSDNNTLFYVASGYTWTEADVSLRIGTNTERRTFDFDGIPLEVGIEHKFGPNVRGRLAGRYTWYGDKTVAESAFGRDDELRNRLTAEPGALSIKAGVVISTGGLDQLF